MTKSVIPLLSSCLFRLHMHALVRSAEIGMSLLQGKGAGSGWDMSGELRAAAACIKRPDPVLVDVGANYGKWAQGMLKLFPATRKVLLFEPQEECLVKLAGLPLPGKAVIPSALSDHSGMEPFYVGGAGGVQRHSTSALRRFLRHNPNKELWFPLRRWMPRLIWKASSTWTS